MSDIRKWLEEIGLGAYADAFDAEQIDIAALPHVTEADLKEMGLPIGPRRKALAAIAKLPDVNKVDGESAGPRAEPSARVSAAERRQLTVMFCDLVGSTSLSERLDPEDLRAIMAAYRKATGDVITRYDGHVAQFLGDGIMAYFGWPRAHEDDAERAVRAALDIVDAVKSVDGPAPLQVRVGIATGRVVVGEDTDDDADGNKLAVGETPNVAARLQGLAEPDEIVIGPRTRQLTGGAFNVDDLGARDLKGILEPVRAWRVNGASVAEGRFEARSTGGLTPLVGRDAEIQFLLDRWEQAKHGEGQVVLLEGEPGIGKSRITQVLRERLADEPHIGLRHQCSPFHANSAFYPIIDQLERAAGFARDDAPDQKLDKLETILTQGADDVPEVAPLIAAILSLPLDRYPPLNLSPQRQKDDTIAALAARIMGLAKQQPVLLLVEDAHWCDPTTLDTLTAVIGRIETAPVLAVITYRPEFQPSWTGYGHVVTQSLSRLGKHQGAEMVTRVTGGKAMPDEVFEQIVAKTDGIPLFVEELTKTVLEAGFLVDRGDAYILDGPLPPLAIPATLQDSLMARLDRLGAVKEVAQTGACIGREFSYDLLAAVSPLQGDELEDALEQLVDSELIFVRGSPPEATYTFKHALIQDSAYGSLLRSRRQQLHLGIANAIENDFAFVAEAEPELLGYHLGAADKPAAAAPQFIRAGHKAVLSYSLMEAINHFKEALTQNSAIEDVKTRDLQELEVRLALAHAFMVKLGWAAREIPETLVPAQDICASYQEIEKLCMILFYRFVHYWSVSDVGSCYELVDEIRSATNNDSLLYYVLAGGHFLSGSFFECGKAMERHHESYSVEASSDWMGFANQYLKGPSLGHKANVDWILGYPDRARDSALEMVELARGMDNLSLLWALTGGAGMVLLFRGEIDLYLAQIGEARDIAIEQANEFFEECVCPFWAGPGMIAIGDFANGYDALAPAVDLWHQTGGVTNVPLMQAYMARALTGMGRAPEALALINDTLSLIAKTGHRSYEAEVLRIKGEANRAVTTDEPYGAETCFKDAIRLARDQKAKGWELRAAMSLARLWESQGKTKDAYDLLVPVYDWFTEGLDTADVRDAKALLARLQ